MKGNIMAKLHLHHLGNSRSFRIVWLLEELGLPYQMTTYERVNGLAPASLQKIHPMGKAPILQDNDKTLIESATIIEYLIDHYDNTSENQLKAELISQMLLNKKFRPDYGTTAYEQYRYWLHFAEGSLMPLLVMRLLLATTVKKSPMLIKPISQKIHEGIEKSYLAKTLDKELTMLNEHLANHQWLAGEQFTGADIQLEFGLNALQKKSSFDNKYPNISRWLQQCHARPAYQKAVKADVITIMF